jgi:hypothetical protein
LGNVPTPQFRLSDTTNNFIDGEAHVNYEKMKNGIMANDKWNGRIEELRNWGIQEWYDKWRMYINDKRFI